MTKRVSRILAMLGLVVAANFMGCSSDPVKSAFVGDTAWILENPDTFEFVTLDPSPKAMSGEVKDADRMQGYPVIGKAAVTDPALQKQLVGALEKAVRDNTSTAASCFNPRHGIRATRKGESVDLVICFSCLQIDVVQGRSRKFSTLSSEPKGLFNQLAAQMKLRVVTQPAE